MNTSHEDTREKLRKELERARAMFHQLHESLSEGDFQKQSLNPGWTNGEIMAHMAFGFIILNALLPMARFWGRLPKASSKWFAGLLNAFTGLFNRFNMLGARGQGRSLHISEKSFFAIPLPTSIFTSSRSHTSKFVWLLLPRNGEDSIAPAGMKPNFRG